MDQRLSQTFWYRIASTWKIDIVFDKLQEKLWRKEYKLNMTLSSNSYNKVKCFH